MPLVLDETQQLPEGARATLPLPAEAGPGPSALEVAAAAERQANVAGMAYERFYANPRPTASPVPDFDPIASVPKGYETFADRFLGAESPSDVQWIKGRLDQELADRRTVARAGGWGIAATLAAGATDPLSIASMALPLGGETRITQAVRLAALNAATTGAQELAAQQLTETRTGSESLTNIGASAILGGILGAAIRPRVPLQEFERLRTNLDAELGPASRSVVDGRMPSEGPVPPGVSPSEMRAPLAYTPLRPEGPTKPTPGNVPAVEPGKMSLLEAAAVTKAAGAETHGLSLNEAIAQGLDPVDLRAARFGSRPVFTRGGASLDAMAESLAQHGYPVTDEAGAYSPNELLDAIDLELRGKPQYSPAAGDYLAALEAHAQASSAADRLRPGAAYEAELERDARMLDSREVEPGSEEYHVNPFEESTAGAASVARAGLAANTLVGPAKTIAEGVIGRVAPGLRLITSPSNTVRDLVQQLAEGRELLQKNLQGVATPTAVETLLRRYEGDWWQGWKARGEAFRAYRERMAGSESPVLTRREFGHEVAYAMRRGDQSIVPEVADAARKTRAIVFEPLKARAQQLGLLPKDLAVTGADSYLMRQYDQVKIRANYARWLDTLTDGFVRQGVDRVEARDIAYQATRSVLGSERGTMDFHVLDDVVPASGRFQERKLRLPDAQLEPFLNSDIDHLSHSYLRSMAPEVEFTERFGTRDMKEQLDQVRDEYARLSEQAIARGDRDAVAGLDARRDADIRDLSAIRDRLYGIYGQPKNPGSWFVRAGRLLRSDNALRLLGAATLAHVPDVANVITRYGLGNTLAAIAKLGTSWEALQVTREEARRIGVGLDMVMNTTAAMLGDYGTHSRFLEQRVAARLTRAFTIATGETPLIATIQSLASVIAQDELLRNARGFAAGKVPARFDTLTLPRLAAAGIDQDMLRRIGAEAAQHGQEVNGLHFGMSSEWRDQAAARAFEAAILKDAHAMTLSPGAGDTPLLMSTEVGKLLLQFKSFAFAASRHVLMPIAQGIGQGDMRAATGLAALVAAGYGAYWAKQKAAGQPIETENMGRLALEVLDKSNLLGWTGEAIYPALWSFGFKDFSRWSDRDPVETMGGPSAGTVAGIYEHRLPSKLLGNQEDREQTFTRADLHFLRRLMPGQNLWYFRRAVNALEDSVGDLFNLPGKSNEDRQSRLAANQ